MNLENPEHIRANHLAGRLALWAGPLTERVNGLLDLFEHETILDAIFARSPAVWSTDHASQAKISNRLGWLSSPDWVLPHLPRVRAFAESVRNRGVTDVVLLGMGGSSLAPEVLRSVIGVKPGWPHFWMLDSTDPAAILTVDRQITLPSTIFLLASKSGGTIEPNSMAAYFQHRLETSGLARWADHFVAVTDEGTALHQRATSQGFLDVFVNPSDIGGRYSALSLFGLVPAALMGQDIDTIVDWARAMMWLCGPERPLRSNPAVLLGAAMSLGALAGRDKMTLVLPPALETFGLWVEQLVAESTGKQGNGVVPIAGEAPASPAQYGTDRLFVALDVCPSPSAGAHAELRTLAAAGAPWVQITMPEPEALGAEFVRWELATAVAGAILGVNPFDEPNVQQAKDATRRLLDSRHGAGSVPRPDGGIRLGPATVWLSSAARAAMGAMPPARYLDVLGANDYLAMLAYLGPDSTLVEPLAALRRRVVEHTHCATTFGYGPRYLHSTGQLHKGGANNGVFLVMLAPPATDIAVPGQPFSFGELEHAQALGDFASLEAAGRRVMAVEFDTPSAADIKAFCDALETPAR
jgi:glucose-6-phosphate isomerase